MDFKTQMKLDAKKVFLNEGEFAEPINWNGKPDIIAVVTEDGDGQIDGDNFDQTRPGVSILIKNVLVLSGDIERPRLYKEIQFNGEEWIVSRSQKKGVMLDIQIYRERS